MPGIADLVPIRRPAFDRILFDMNTQCDLLLPHGAMPIINRAAALHNIRKLMSWARVETLPVVSSLECRRNGDRAGGLPPYCIDRSAGQKKVPITLLPRRIVVHNNNTLDVPAEPFRRFQQIILMKRSTDFLSNPKVDRFLNTVSVKHLIVFGAVAERCVKAVVLGLLARGHRVGVVSDACGGWSSADAELAMRLMHAKGAVLVTTEDLISGCADEWLRTTPATFIQEVHNSAGESVSQPAQRAVSI